MEKIVSTYPPVCIQGPVSCRWYIVASGRWIEVDRQYHWNELEPIWIKDTNYTIPIPKKTNFEIYHMVGVNGEIYVVKNDDGVWSCTCPAHGFGRGKDCKHIKEIKTNEL